MCSGRHPLGVTVGQLSGRHRPNRPWRFSIKPCPMKHSFASLPRPLRVEPGLRDRWSRHACRSIVSGRGKSLSVLRPPPSAGRSPEPSFGLTLFTDAPCLDQRAVHREVVGGQKLLPPWAVPALPSRQWNFAAMSPSSSRSRFFENTEMVPTPRRRRRRSRQTNGTEGRTPAAPSKDAPSGLNRRFAAALPAAAFSGGIEGRPHRRIQRRKIAG